MTHKSTLEKYGPSFHAGELTEDDLVQADTFLQQQNFADMNEWSDARTALYDLNGQRFHMLIDRPNDGDTNKAVIVGGEFGNGIAPAAVARARIVRDMVAPEATLIYQPNPTLAQPDNMNFSPAERRMLREGDSVPMLGRLAVVLNRIGNPEDLTFYGPSQGGVVSLGFAAHRDTPKAAVAVIETPNVEDRSSLKLAQDFAGAGAQLKDVVRENYADPDTPFAKETIDSLSAVGLAGYAAGLLRRDNLAMRGVLRRADAEQQMAATLDKGGGVVHAFGTVDRVSPLEANLHLSEVFAGNPRYRSTRFEGADHSITNHYALCGALARTAHRLMYSS